MMAAKLGKPVGNKISSTTACPGRTKWYDGTQHPWEFKRIWHFEPSLTDAEPFMRE